MHLSGPVSSFVVQLSSFKTHHAHACVLGAKILFYDCKTVLYFAFFINSTKQIGTKDVVL